MDVSVLRVGKGTSTRNQAATLDEAVKTFAGTSPRQGGHNDYFEKEQKARARYRDLSAVVNAKVAELFKLRDAADDAGETVANDRVRSMQAELDKSKEEKKQAFSKLKQCEAYTKEQKKKRKKSNENMRAAVLDKARVVCTTLGSAGHHVFAQGRKGFGTVIVDEAAQAVELSALIPLQHGCVRCVLVGDPQQLAATVLSKVAESMKYTRSLFERLQTAGHPVHLLDTQYRMHPEIAAFPSKHFYGGRLRTAVSQRDHPPPRDSGDKRQGAYLVCDVRQGQAKQQDMSWSNFAEAMLSAKLFYFLRAVHHTQGDFAARVGIVTPYRQQVSLIRRQLTVHRPPDALDATQVEVSTVDSFQGREKDFIIFSCVRASEHGGGIGFLKQTNRMNVALTRARLGMFVLCKFTTLTRDPTWRALIEDANERGLSMCVNDHSFQPASLHTFYPPPPQLPPPGGAGSGYVTHDFGGK
jgi:senataxin